ncbi:MAG: VCBS repeat-containing protein [candidate division Zixibacteria bacterium]|nr:VCBS repeat-containing protein [candidate division Zixibacteria bacterium]
MRGRAYFCAGIIMLALGGFAVGQVPLDPSPFWMSTEQSQYSTGMAWRDCNRDGFLDLFVSNGNDIVMAPNRVYYSHSGNLETTSSWQSANAEYSGHCSVGDVNDDGYPDFAVADYIGSGGFSTGNRSHVYLNNGGFLSTTPDWTTGDSIYTFSCAFGDADGDGDLDLAFATGEPYNGILQNNLIYYNIDGVLQSTPGWQSVAGTASLDVAWGDVDNNGYLDLAFGHGDGQVVIHYNYGGSIETTPSYATTAFDLANTVFFGDVNDDGWLDLLVAYNYQTGGTGYYCVYFNDGAGVINPVHGWQSDTEGYGSAICLYDYDNDGDDDLAAGRWWDRPRIYENTGTTFTTSPIWRGDPSVVVEELAWGDVDGDGVEFRADTVYAVGGKRLYYTSHHPLYAIDSVLVDGSLLGDEDYCFDPVAGWVSLGVAPLDSVVMCYQYSFKNDLGCVNWDTYNLVFGNTNRPYVEFYADTMVGQAPLTVQFTDSSAGASDWNWSFGDGGASPLQDPIHTYNGGGAFDVYLENTLPDGPHNRIRRRMIITFADTLRFPTVVAAGQDTIKVPVYLTNCHPMHHLVLPVYHGGDGFLKYVDFDTDSCRTDYFENVDLVNLNPYGNQLVLTFSPTLSSPQPPLGPGTGRIVNLYFQHVGGTGINTLDTTTLSTKSLLYDADYVEYKPVVISGAVILGDVIRGDANNDMAVNLLDILFLIDFLYDDGPEPLLYQGDYNADGSINLLDILDLIGLLYG